MMAPVELAVLATAAAKLLLGEAGKEAAKKAGGALWDKLGDLLRRKPKTKEALDDLGGAPDDPDALGALRLQIRKAIEDDPAFGNELEGLLDEMKETEPAIQQIANVTGDHNTTIQISGSDNDVST